VQYKPKQSLKMCEWEILVDSVNLGFGSCLLFSMPVARADWYKLYHCINSVSISHASTLCAMTLGKSPRILKHPQMAMGSWCLGSQIIILYANMWCFSLVQTVPNIRWFNLWYFSLGWRESNMHSVETGLQNLSAEGRGHSSMVESMPAIHETLAQSPLQK
jgi:hypothetical protein